MGRKKNAIAATGKTPSATKERKRRRCAGKFNPQKSATRNAPPDASDGRAIQNGSSAATRRTRPKYLFPSPGKFVVFE